MRWLALATVMLGSCAGARHGTADASPDAIADAPTDASPDVIADAPTDASPDVSHDAHGADDGGIDAASVETLGRISIVSDPASALATVRFYGAEGNYNPTRGERCRLELFESGRCFHRTCAAATPSANINAGVVRFTEGADVVEWTPDGDGEYSGDVGDWQPGDTIAVSAAGATAPPFATTITLPAPRDISPTLASPVDRSAGAVITFVPVTSDIRVQINSAASTEEIGCIREGASGTATLGAELLALLPAGAAFFDAFPVASSTVLDGTNRVDVLAGTRTSNASTSIVLE